MSPSQDSLRYELGAWLAILLANSGLSATALAREMRCSVSKVSRMTSPSASRSISYSDARIFLDAVECPPEERERFLDRLDELLANNRVSAYRKFHTPADWTRREAVSSAPVVMHHGRSIPPWLLPDYAIGAWLPTRFGESPQAFTGRKQSLLAQGESMLEGTQSILTIIGEELLDRAGPEWMRHLHTVINRLGVYVYPYGVGHHPAMIASYTICRWPNSPIPDALFEDTITNPVAHYDDYTVQRAHGWFEELLDLSIGGTQLQGLIDQKLVSCAA